MEPDAGVVLVALFAPEGAEVTSRQEPLAVEAVLER